jgi:hypothetical protein
MATTKNDVITLLEAFDKVENSTLRKELAKLLKRAVGLHVDNKTPRFAVSPPHPNLPLPTVAMCNQARSGKKLDSVRSYKFDNNTTLMEAKQQIEWGMDNRF